MSRIPVYWLCFRTVIPYLCTLKICEMFGNTSMACVSSCSNILNPEDGLVVLQFSPNLVPLLGWSEAWINRILVCWLCLRLVWSCPFANKTYAILCNTFMACWSSCNNIHQLKDGMVTLQSSANLVPHLGWSVAWSHNIYVYWLCYRIVGPYPRIYTTHGMLATHQWHVVLYLTTYSILNNILNIENVLMVLQLAQKPLSQCGCYVA